MEEILSRQQVFYGLIVAQFIHFSDYLCHPLLQGNATMANSTDIIEYLITSLWSIFVAEIFRAVYRKTKSNPLLMGCSFILNSFIILFTSFDAGNVSPLPIFPFPPFLPPFLSFHFFIPLFPLSLSSLLLFTFFFFFLFFSFQNKSSNTTTYWPANRLRKFYW